MSESKSSTTIQSLQQGFQILDLVASREEPFKFNEIHEGTQITKSNLYKYLNTLTQQGILYREKETGLYSLGSKLVEYGMTAVNRDNVIDRATSTLHEISRVTKCTTLLTTWSLNGPLVVKMTNLNSGLNIGAQIGTALPVLSATGKIFAAYMDHDVIAEWLLQQTGNMSDSDKAALQEQYSLIRTSGISFAKEPLVPSISSLSVPILNYANKLIGSIVVVGFINIVPQHKDDEMAAFIMQKGKELSATYGYKEE
ncbi:IclR family transcriptional regulator [Paenibacillus thalictri]|uniref:IclR family transcriptional regulator n=1 Tax=Paenibacillus thalictri TaxID=2527873 RepID=A0A4Q9DSS5_9BACL|nr:IclR family transcriptional regulator [Paenibacillus thalictri]TBL78539.1 IclR family transcriptional regulator [Paenibacillus thalictri]